MLYKSLHKPLVPGLLLGLSLLPALAHADLYISIVQGLGGMPEYQEEFDATRDKISAASITMTDEDKVVTFSGDAATRDVLLAHFTSLAERMTEDDRAAVYLIGHGSFDGDTYKFNIPGPDLTGNDFREVLDKLPGSNHFLVNTSSTSGAMVEAVLGTQIKDNGEVTAAADAEQATVPDYILVAATRNGNERNATHFGRFFADALVNADADINKNNNISVQEAFDFADRSVAAYFEEAGRLATEHAQLQGDGAARFSLARLDAVTLEADDPLVSDLLQQRQDIEAQIEDLQLRRDEYTNAQYLQRLQALVLQSAEITEQIDAQQGSAGEGEAGGTE